MHMKTFENRLEIVTAFSDLESHVSQTLMGLAALEPAEKTSPQDVVMSLSALLDLLTRAKENHHEMAMYLQLKKPAVAELARVWPIAEPPNSSEFWWSPASGVA
jgi:hypothetical protein